MAQVRFDVSLADADGWVPRTLPGGVYCSPRCGGGCTKAEHDSAVRRAEAMAARLGEGWQIEVWENLGWHWRVKRGAMTLNVHENHNCDMPPDGWPILGYSAWFEPQVQIGRVFLQLICDADTPEDAIGFARQEARTLIRRIEDDLAGSE